MSRSVNKAILIGNLGRAPELRRTQDGKAVANFSLATTSSWTGADGEQQEHTEWHDIVAWGRLAEICDEFLEKGSRIYAEGEIRTRSWEGKDGQKRYRTEIILSNMMMLDPRAESGAAPAKAAAPDEITDDDIPF